MSGKYSSAARLTHKSDDPCTDNCLGCEIDRLNKYIIDLKHTVNALGGREEL